MSAGQLAAGQRVDKYLLVRLLGQGAMGTVWEARNTGTRRRVALKLMLPQFGSRPELVQRFHREAQIAGKLESRHVVQVLDNGQDPATGSPFLVLEYLIGEDLDHIVMRKPLEPLVALRVASQALLGLRKAHGLGMVHRDIKPANLFLALQDEESTTLVVKILDFGIAKDVELEGGGAKLTSTEHTPGTRAYMSPEQMAGRRALIDHRSDIYALGAALYESISGRLPFAHCETIEHLIFEVGSGKPPPPLMNCAPWVLPQIAAVVHRALAPVGERFPSADAMLEAIRGVLGPNDDFSLTEAAVGLVRPAVTPSSMPSLFEIKPQPLGIATTSVGVTSPALKSGGSRILPVVLVSATAISMGAAAVYWRMTHVDGSGASAIPAAAVTPAPPTSSAEPVASATASAASVALPSAPSGSASAPPTEPSAAPAAASSATAKPARTTTKQPQRGGGWKPSQSF